MNNSKLKESNIKWLGKIPDNWKTIKFNALYDLRNEKVSDKDFPPLSVTKMGIVPQLSNAAKTNNGDNRKLVEIGDFAINSRSDRRGSCGISKYEGSVSLINTVLKPINREMNPRYYGWLFKTVEFADEFYKWGHGIVDDLWTTNWQDMKNITLVCPSKTEQNKIADFLDKKVLQIDDISKKIQQEITDLEKYRKSIITKAVTKGLSPNVPMKNSNISWIGEVPSNWHIEKLKFIAETRNNKELLSNVQNNYIGLENIVKNTGQYVCSNTTYEEGYYDVCKKGDILYGKLRPNLSKVLVAPFDSCCSGEFLIFKSAKINLKYLFYYLLSQGITEIATSAIYGTKMPRVSWDFIKNLFISFPPKNEDQKEIVNYLDIQCNKIDSILKNKHILLKKLNQYKQSIIYEYVTGKKQVPTEEGAVE